MKSSQTILLLLFLTLILTACESSEGPSMSESTAEEVPLQKAESEEPPEHSEQLRWNGQWSLTGALRNVNLHGNIEPQGRIEEILDGDLQPNHGVGAIGGLRGELTLWDQEIAIARGGEEPLFSIPSTEEIDEDLEATFFFATRVEEWTEVSLPETMSRDEFSDFLESLLEKHGVDGALPFRFHGEFASLHAHVVDADSLPEGGGQSCGQRKEHSYQFGGDELSGRLVGIFTRAHTSVIVDHTTFIHAHAILDDQRSGHLDDFALPAGAAIQIPARSER